MQTKAIVSSWIQFECRTAQSGCNDGSWTLKMWRIASCSLYDATKSRKYTSDSAAEEEMPKVNRITQTVWINVKCYSWWQQYNMVKSSKKEFLDDTSDLKRPGLDSLWSFRCSNCLFYKSFLDKWHQLLFLAVFKPHCASRGVAQVFWMLTFSCFSYTIIQSLMLVFLLH